MALANKKGNWKLQGENALQAEFCKILDLFKIRYYSIPNGINIRNFYTQWIFKVTGRKRGVPDLHIPKPIFVDDQIKYLSLYIETKLPKQYPDKDQKEWHEYLRSEGHFVAVVKSTKELIELLKQLYPNNFKNVKI